MHKKQNLFRHKNFGTEFTMRLSLKTILAYSDQLFDTEYRLSVEKRIGEEGMAGYLVDRIRSVVCNPGISVPGRHGDKEELSGNLVAAYLDGQLSDSEQSQFETICLRSDIYLAEVACTHQILTTILGQPAKLNRDCRLRLYAIPRHRNQERLQVSGFRLQDDGSIPEAESPKAEVQYQTVESESVAETAPMPRKKRRITVTAEKQEVGGKREEGRDMREGTNSSDGQAVEDVAEPVSSHFTSYLLPFTSLPLTSHVGKISRLGQAFAHQKRHRMILLAASLGLLLLCVSIYLISNLMSGSPEQEVAQHRSRATATDILKTGDDTHNDQHFDDHHRVWGQHAPAPVATSSPPDFPLRGAMTSQANPDYSMQSPPTTVMQYLPGVSHPASDFGIQDSRPEFRTANPEAQIPDSSVSVPTLATSAPPQPAAMPAAIVEPSPPIPQWPPQQMVTVPISSQLAVQPNSVQSGYSPSAVNLSNSRTNISMAGTTSATVLPNGHPQSNAQFAVRDRLTPFQTSPRQQESTIQLIDRGNRSNAPSLDRFVNPTLPAVQPPTWGGEREELRRQREEGVSGSTSGTVSSPLTSYLLPLASSIEQASFVIDPHRPGMPPSIIEPVLVEPYWTERRSDSFEHVNDASPPLRLPENRERLQASDFRHQERASNAGADTRSLNLEACMLVLDIEDIVLVRDTPDAEWSWLPVSKQLGNDIVLVPAPFRATLRFPNGIVVATEGDTRVQVLPNDETGRPTLAFDCGHLTIYATRNHLSHSEISQSLRIVTPVGGGVLRLTDTNSFVTMDSENKTTVKLLKVTRPYESVTGNPILCRSHFETNVIYCPNLMTYPVNGKTVYWQKDGHSVEWELGSASIFPIDIEKSIGPVLLYDTSNLIVSPTVVWPSLVSHDGRIPISKLDLKNQFVTMPKTFYPTPSKIWLLK